MQTAEQKAKKVLKRWGRRQANQRKAYAGWRMVPGTETTHFGVPCRPRIAVKLGKVLP